MHKWYYMKTGLLDEYQVGPVTEQELKKLCYEGTIKPNTNIVSPTRTKGRWVEAKKLALAMKIIEAGKAHRRELKRNEKARRAEMKAQKKIDAIARLNEIDDTVADGSRKGIGSWLAGTGKREGYVEFVGTGNFVVEVVGESHYQKHLKRVCGGYSKNSQRVGATATLVYEDDNPHDEDAIRVDIENSPVGYLSSFDARVFRIHMEENGHAGMNATCEAIVVGGWKRSRTDIGSFGVRLDLKLD